MIQPSHCRTLRPLDYSHKHMYKGFDSNTVIKKIPRQSTYIPNWN